MGIVQETIISKSKCLKTQISEVKELVEVHK